MLTIALLIAYGLYRHRRPSEFRNYGNVWVHSLGERPADRVPYAGVHLHNGRLVENFPALIHIGGRRRRERATQAGKYIDGLIADLPRKNGWTLAEQTGDHRPGKMQRLLNHTVWDHQQDMGVASEFVIEHLADPAAVLVLDESGREKSGWHTVGMKRQYVGCAGKITMRCWAPKKPATVT